MNGRRTTLSLLLSATSLLPWIRAWAAPSGADVSPGSAPPETALAQANGRAAAAIGFKNWGPFTRQSETRRNNSGKTQAYAPVKFLMQFHKRALPPNRWLQLRDDTGRIVPPGEWQAGERVTYDDGSLQSCIVRCYGPANWPAGADLTWTLEAVDGRWPEESDARTVADVATVCDVNIELSDIRRIGPHGDPAQPSHVHTGLKGNLNRSLQHQRTSKRTGGSICTQWCTWGRFRSGDTDDQHLWWKAWVEVWYAPGGSTIRHISVHPVINNGWAFPSGAGRALVFKCKIVNGSRTIIDYAERRRFTEANVGVRNHNMIIDLGLDINSHSFLPGCAAYIESGEPPSGLVVGKIQQICASVETLGGFDPWMKEPTAGYLGVVRLGIWNSTPMQNPPKYKGKGWTMTSGIQSMWQHPLLMLDRDGMPLWPVGGAGMISPNWNRQQKIYRMQVGQIPNVMLDDAAPGYTRGDRRYMPGARSLHRQGLDDPGGLYQLGFHIGEIGTWTWDVLQDMTVAHSHKTLLRAAAEVVGISQYCGYYDNRINPATGVEFAELVDFTNGPNDDGKPFPNLGPPQPLLARPSHGGSGLRAINDAPGDQSWNIGTASSHGRDGTHFSMAMARCFELYPEPLYREMLMGMAMGAPIECELIYLHDPNAQRDDEIALLGLNKRLEGRNYYRVITSGVAFITQGYSKRTHIGATAAMKGAFYNPDASPLGPYVRKYARTQFEFMRAFWNSSRMGLAAKILGPMTSFEGHNPQWPLLTSEGGQQHWQLARIATAGLRLLKLTGQEYPEVLQWCTSMSRVIMGHPVVGKPMRQHKLIFPLGVGITLFDRPQRNLSPLTEPRLLITRFSDAASSTGDASSCHYSGGAKITFHPDGKTITLSDIAGGYYDPEIAPSNGTPIQLNEGRGFPEIPSGIRPYVPYYLYNKSGKKAEFTYNLSSAPGAEVRPVTWTPGKQFAVDRGYVGMNLTIPGPYRGGRWHEANYASDYLRNNVDPVTTALTLFGAESGCLEAHEEWDALHDDLLKGQKKSLAKPGDHFYSAFNTTKYHRA